MFENFAVFLPEFQKNVSTLRARFLKASPPGAAEPNKQMTANVFTNSSAFQIGTWKFNNCDKYTTKR